MKHINNYVNVYVYIYVSKEAICSDRRQPLLLGPCMQNLFQPNPYLKSTPQKAFIPFERGVILVSGEPCW